MDAPVMLDATLTDAFQFVGQDLPQLLEHWVEAHPDKPLLVWEPKDGADQTWTYAEFTEATKRLAVGLAAKGVAKGDKVLIHADNCPEMVLAWYACAQIGAVGVTTNTRSVSAEMNYFITHTGCVGAITQPQYASLVSGAADLGWIVVTDDNSGVAASPEETSHGFDSFDSLYGDGGDFVARDPEPMLPVGILFTSGTTSRPKAVVHTHANALWAGRMGPDTIDFRNDDKYLIYLPFFHVNAQSWSLWTALGAGGTVVLQPKYSASRFWEVIAKHQITHISLIPFVFKAIQSEPIPEHSVRVGVFGLIMPILEDWLGMRVVAAYGMTETVIHATRDDALQGTPDMSMGRPTPGYEFIIVNQDTGQICEKGEIGELWVRGTRGVQLFLEYYDNAEAMAKGFTDDGWFKTGDLVRWEDGGNFFYCERDSDALKVGGENVSTREVEDVCRTVPGIDDIAVVGQTHDMLDMVPVAFVIKGDGAEPDDDAFGKAIIDACAENLADFKVPRAVYVVDEFPRATLDKVAKNKLREMADERLS